MTDALDAAPDEAMSDTLQDHMEEPRAAEVKISEEPKKSLDDTLRESVDKALKDEKPEKTDTDEKPVKEPIKADKADPKDKPEAKVDAKADKDAIEGDPVVIKEPKTTDDPDKPDPKPTAFKDPPNGFDDAAKKEWDAVPESVRGAVHRRAQEMESGIHKYRQDAEQFDSVRQYADMAKQSGTDLPTALHRYTNIENQLRENPMQGLQAVVANLGLKKSDGTPVTLRDIAANIMGQTPDQAASRQEATISHLNRQITQLQEQIGGFSKHVEQQQQQSRVTSAESTWGQFQQANPRAAELEPQIAQFLTKYPAENTSVGERLQDAYDWAVSRNPSVAHTDPKPLAQTQTSPRQPNPAGKKSVSGAGGESRTVRKTSSDDAIKRAIAKLNG